MLITFGTRELTAKRAIMQPEDLKSQKIKGIPFPVHMAAVQGLGADPAFVDWSEVPVPWPPEPSSGRKIRSTWCCRAAFTRRSRT